MIKGFTLLELIVVIVIIGILATLGVTQYTTVVEKGRTAEAKMILGLLRKFEVAYNLENGTYAVISGISTSPPTACTSTHYFSYTATAGSNIATAIRCTASGKAPNASAAYSLTVNYDTGVWGGTASYY